MDLDSAIAGHRRRPTRKTRAMSPDLELPYHHRWALAASYVQKWTSVGRPWLRSASDVSRAALEPITSSGQQGKRGFRPLLEGSSYMEPALAQENNPHMQTSVRNFEIPRDAHTPPETIRPWIAPRCPDARWPPCSGDAALTLDEPAPSSQSGKTQTSERLKASRLPS